MLSYDITIDKIFLCYSDDLREHLKNAPKNIMDQEQDVDTSDSDSDSDSDSSSGRWTIKLIFIYLHVLFFVYF